MADLSDAARGHGLPIGERRYLGQVILGLTLARLYETIPADLEDALVDWDSAVVRWRKHADPFAMAPAAEAIAAIIAAPVTEPGCQGARRLKPSAPSE